jgi:predicted Kef-type K+ transport protein
LRSTAGLTTAGRLVMEDLVTVVALVLLRALAEPLGGALRQAKPEASSSTLR